MSQHPTTFAAESAGEPGFGWEDYATLHHLEGGGGLLHGFKRLRSGTLAQLVRFVASLPPAERDSYMIEKAGDRQYLPREIMELAQRDDLPL